MGTAMLNEKNKCLRRVVGIEKFCIAMFFVIMLLSTAASAAAILKVSTSRYSVFSPWNGKPAAGALSSDFTAYALLIGEDGKPVSGANITFEIYSPASGAAGKKATKYDLTKQNGLANVSYDTINDFTANNDADYGSWNITAYLISNASIRGTVFMRIDTGGDGIVGCSKTYCHNPNTNVKPGTDYPRSPYTEHYNQTNTRAEAAHLRGSHVNNGCYYCHPGYAAIKTGSYGNTSDVHKNRTCDFCHGDWTYISTGGIPKMPSCYDCHPVYNNNPTIISTLANLLAGNNISIYSFNFDKKAPLTAHNGTDSSFTNSVPCIACHGPAHNNTKPDPLPANTNNITESSQCILCHGQKHFTGTSCTDCHSQNAHAIIKPQGGGSAGNYTGNSSNCKTCHPAQYALWANTTHTSKLITKEDAIARDYPLPPPNGTGNWSDVSFVIGSKWKIRYVNNTGYIITQGGGNQYNIDDQKWTDYNKNASKKYNCGHCHATGYLSNVTNETKEPFRTLRSQGTIVYDNSSVKGFVGYWAENSIGCEACHGQGGDHIAGGSPNVTNIPRNASVLRNSPGVCGDCHSRPNSTKYGEYEGFNPYPYGVNDTLLDETLYDPSPMPTYDYSKVGGHHEQWEDWKSSNHSNNAINCVTCHGGHSISDPAYAGGPTGKTKFTNGTVYPAAVNKTCIDCHIAELPKHGYYTNSSECISCHMPINRKSSNKNDLRSHWFNTSAMKSNKNGEIHGYNFPVLKNVSSSCNLCHGTQSGEVTGSDHNKTLNINAPACKDCHITGYATEIVNETTTCNSAQCHNSTLGANRPVNESHGNKYYGPNKADCTQCHFANTTQKFDKNATLYRNSHILTVEYNFYNYNISGMPLESNGGAGKGMFPYYACTLTCHNVVNGSDYRIEEEVISWNESAHARSRHGNQTYDSKNSCAKCKSPPNYNVSASSSAPISDANWQGIQCRVCHNLHNDTYSGNQSPAFPLAFYNATTTSNKTTNPTGSAIYDKVANATVLCENCHTGATHNSKYAGTHKDVVGFDCASCHANSTFNSESHLFEVKNTTSGVTGCKVCHTENKPWANLSIHNNTKHANNVTCEACHDKTVARNATGYAVNATDEKVKNVSVVYGLYLDPATGMVSSYKDSHGAPATWPLHNISRDVSCNKCHGTMSNATGLLAPPLGEGTGCISCHNNSGSATSKVDITAFGLHARVNTTDGGLNDSDCKTCHFNTTGMGTGYQVQQGVNVYTCLDCHVEGNYSAPVISNHRPAGISIKTTTYCSTCHNNSINKFAYSVNASVGHYGTNASLIKPTVNSTPSPAFGFVDSAEAEAYNQPCKNCHNPYNQNYGTSVNITRGHTSNATCDQCHVNTAARDLHNNSLRMPTSFYCSECHKTYADQFNAPNLTGTDHSGYTCSSVQNCHGGDGNSNGQLDELADHNIDITLSAPKSLPNTGNVNLNGAASVSVSKGTIVNVTSQINDTYTNPNDHIASRVGGAEFFLNTSPDPGLGKGIPMNAVDGFYDSVNGALENVTGTIDTGSLSEGTYLVYVRGMDIGKQWSTVQSATLTVLAAKGYINGTVMDNSTKAGIPYAKVTTNTSFTVTANSTGFYSINIDAGTYMLTATSDPRYYSNSSVMVAVAADNTSVKDIELAEKPKGTISGSVRNA